MKISNKEKIMLFILGIILIGFGYYNFVYCVQINTIGQKTKQESEIKQKYEITMNTIKDMDAKKSDVKILKTKIKDQSLPFYPTISEEHIILELDKLLKDSELEGSITFQPIVSDSVENSKKEEKSLAESSLKGIVDKYNNISTDDEKTQESNDKTVNNSTNGETNSSDSNDSGKNNSNSSKTSSKADSKDTKKNTVQYLKCEIKFEGSYEGIDKLLNTIGKNEKKIVVNSIKISSDTLDKVKGSINIEIYSVPKINDELENYLKWDLSKTYGKSIPFDLASGFDGGQANTSTGKQTTDEASSSDFVASVKSMTSDLPKVIFGKTNDDLKISYIYGDNNSEEPIEMVLTQEGDKYYYKYKTSKESFPTNYDGIGEEFIPSVSNIGLNILSEVRANSSDNSSISIKIINKTDKTIDVNIFGDDSFNPRVTVDGNENTVKVNKH